MTPSQVIAPQLKGRMPGRLPDAGAGVLTTAVLVAMTSQISPGPRTRPADAFAYVVLVAAGGSMALLRRRPRNAVAVVTADLCAERVRN